MRAARHCPKYDMGERFTLRRPGQSAVYCASAAACRRAKSRAGSALELCTSYDSDRVLPKAANSVGTASPACACAGWQDAKEAANSQQENFIKDFFCMGLSVLFNQVELPQRSDL